MAWQGRIESVAPNMADTLNVWCNVAFYDDAVVGEDGLPVVQFVSQVVFPVGGSKTDLFAIVEEKGKEARACYLAAQGLIAQADKMIIAIPDK